MEEDTCQILLERVSTAQRKCGCVRWLSLPFIQEASIAKGINRSISTFSRLHRLDWIFDDSLVIDFDALATLGQLEYLNFELAMNLDCTGIAKVKSLRRLRISGGIFIIELSALSIIGKQLEEFRFTDCYDLEVHQLRQVLASLRNVKVVDLSRTAVGKLELQALASSGAEISELIVQDCPFVTETDVQAVLSSSTSSIVVESAC
jgi:hypothetical protein